VIDHHPPGNGCSADTAWVQPDMAATAQMLAVMLREWHGAIPGAAATALLVGILMDTGGFRFSNTDAAALRQAAALINDGADYAAAVNALFFNEPLACRRLAARVLEAAEFAHDRRLAYAVVTPEMLQELEVAPGDTEGLIDTLRCIEGVEIACLIQPEPDQVRLSLRSQNPELPVNGIAAELGGGGHALAAGARLPNTTAEQASRRLLAMAGKLLHGH
jgi:phosphoesterase RecJ-like protein